MGKTRSQTLNITIKKEEEEEEDCKTTLLLKGVTNTKNNKITKRKPSRPLSAQQIKVEEDTDTKALLQSSSKPSKRGIRPMISQEEINQLIHCVVNDNMSVYGASRKVNISKRSAYSYYNLYKDDPEKRIPLPRNQTLRPRIKYMQEQVENLIRYINSDKMTLKEASAKANMTYDSGKYYYNRFLKDPNHNIPVPQLQRSYTQDQRNEFIDYIINDKMSIVVASKKAKMKKTTAREYYHRYFKVQNPDIATPSHIATPKCYTQEQIKEVISYIVDDKMSIAAAARKVHMNPSSAARYYRRYLNAVNMGVPVSKSAKRYTQDEINKVIGYIVDDKMSITAASKKAEMHHLTVHKYIDRYLNDQKAR